MTDVLAPADLASVDMAIGATDDRCAHAPHPANRPAAQQNLRTIPLRVGAIRCKETTANKGVETMISVRIVAVTIAAAAAALTIGAAAPVWASQSEAQQNSSVYVVHGIPGQAVDIYVNGDKALSNFEPTKVAGPLDLPAGSYDIVLTKPGDPISSAIVKVDDAAVPGGANLSLVAHLSADGQPTLTPFANDTSAIAAGEARLVVRHTAAAPAVDVRAGGQPVFTDLTNPKEAKADLEAGTVSADVVLAGTSTVALGPADLKLDEGTTTIVYAIGSAEDKTLAITTQVLS